MKSSGFTLIEMMVVVSIIIILTLISIPIYQGSKKELALQRATNKLARDIRRAQEMAMSAKECCGGIVPSGGYGINLTTASSSYILFADCDGGADYDTSGTPCNGFPEELENIEFEKGVMVSSLSPASPLAITFTPPDPTTRVNGSSSTATIILQIDNSPSSVKVLPSGLIYIE